MHPINGLQLNDWAKERHQQAINHAQRELRAKSVACNAASPKLDWLRSGTTALINGLSHLRKRQTPAAGIANSDNES